MAPGRPKQKIEIQNVSAPKRSSDLDSFLSEVTLDWADLDGFGAVKKYNEIVDQLSEYDEMDDDTLVTIYHDLENLLKNKKVPKSGVKEIKRAKLAVKSELLSRKDVGLEDRMIDVVENFTNPITGEKLFDIRQVVDKKTKKVTAIELTYTAAYSALERQVLEGDRNEAGIEHLADMYYEAQAAVYELRNWKTPYYDEVNEALADSWKKPFYRALRLGKEGEVRKSKKMLLKFKSQCESRGLNEEAFIYRRAIETLKTIAIIEVGNLHTRLNNLRNSLDRHSLNLKELNTTEPKLRRMIESQFEVLRVAERLLSADNSLVDLDEVLNILSGEQKVKFKRVYRGGGVKNFNKNIASSEDLKNYLKDNGVNTDNFKVYWGAQTANGFAYWRSKLGAWPYNLKTGKRLENEAQTYPASIDVLRNELPDLTDELAVENPLDIDWAKLIKFEDKGQYDQVDTLYKKHFSHNGFYQTFATKSGVDLDDFVELLSVDNPGQFEASLERYFSLNDPKYAGLKWEMKKIHKDLEEDLEDTMSEYWSRKVLLNYYGKFADKDSDDPAWDTDPKLKELKESFRIQMLHQKYEEFLIENVILKDKDYKNMAEYFERGDDIWTSEKERYQMLLTRGVPKNVLNPKRTPNRMDPLSDGIPTYDKELRSMTKEESLMLQFHVYNQDHKNFEGKLLHFTLAERDELLTKLPVDLLGIMLSAGVSNVIGKSVAMKAATWLEKLGPKFWSGLALSVDLGAARQLLLKQGFKAAFRRILWESGARIPGFFIETLVFTAMERIITNVRQGFNTRMLLDGKAFARQWGHAAVVLGTLRATNAPLTKYLSKYKGMAASVAKGATYITTDAAALTLSGAAYDSVFFGEELDKKYLSRSIKSNVIMAAGVRLGHYALKPIGKITPKGRQLQRGILAIKEQSPDAAKGVKGDTLTSLSAEINKGQPKGEVAMDHVLVGLDSSEINALAKSNTS
ncbi:hypothetical protein HOE67_02180, partial [Candidatus Peregrinibacteria bacterium]|nr:hypothetical protein [Candidatus Peregrinibacteria bacterium]